jgi:hypothetical protein
MDAAIGFRAKTGRAIAVVISAEAGAPRFVWRGEVTLADPNAEVGPYHEVMELPWDEATIAVRPLVAAIESLAEAAVRNLIADLKDVTIRAIGVVGSAPRNIDRIGNPHIRAHAAEGILFRRVLELAAERIALPHLAFTDKELDTDIVRPLGRIAGPPWRADERLAAAAAWAALNRPRDAGTRR